MNKLKLFFGLFLGAVTTLGIASTLSFENSIPVKETNAYETSSVSGGSFFYLDITASASDWTSAEAYLVLVFAGKDGSGNPISNQWTTWNAVSTKNPVTTNIYKFTVPGNSNYTYTKVFAYRNQPVNDGVHWATTNEVTIISNAIKLTSYSAIECCDLNGINSGDTVYLNYNAYSLWDANNTYFYFFNEFSDNSNAWSSKAHIVHGTNDKIIEATVPGDGKTYASVIAVTNTSASFDGKTAQTVDYYVLNSANTRNAMVLENSTDSSGNRYLSWEYSYNLSNDTRSVFWGTYFLSKVKCDDEGSIDEVDWNAVKEEYNALSATIQGIIWLKEGSIVGTDDLETAVYRYDYIVLYKKALYPSIYSQYDDFINRGESSGKSFTRTNISMLPINVNNGAAPIIVSVIAVISLTAIGGYYFLKKGKKEKENTK